NEFIPTNFEILALE
nr:insulin-degrading enzyme, IDE, atrial natriuretic peptide (ANP)-binding protein=peptide 4 {EC 3.4.22.11} [rats, brain, Peptide Partial, 14 aa] [Rattus sp.]